MDIEDFLTKQEEVYARFRNTSKVQSEGTKPNLPNQQGGYLIIFKHAEEISEKIGDFSRKISQSIPLMAYDSKTIHTTISDYNISEIFNPDKNILDNICDSVNSIAVGKLKIGYNEWLYNQDTVLVAGYPNEIFLDISKSIYWSAIQKGINLRMPWGAHITAGRFTKQKSPNDLSDFFKLMKETPKIGISNPKIIDVGYFSFGKKGFTINTYEKFVI